MGFRVRTAVDFAVLSFALFQNYFDPSTAFVIHKNRSIIHARKPGLHVPSRRLYMMYASSGSTKGESESAPQHTFQFVVTYEGRSCEVDAYPFETILDAMERNSVMDKLCLPNMPADCRRGNCMTCAGRILTGDRHDNDDDDNGDDNTEQVLDLKGSKTSDKDAQLKLVQRGDDGLAPYASEILQSSNFILLCSSFVTGDGVRIELGENSRLWEEMYKTRFVDEEAGKTKHEMVAKLLRLRAESDVPRWTAETEEVFEKTEE